jgi:hypothetical protein
MAKDTAKAFAGMLKKEAQGTKMAGKPCKKPPKKGRK